MSFDLNTCAQGCFECIKEYKRKHRSRKTEENPFRISCDGIPQEYVSKDLYEILPEDELCLVEAHLDPVSWAKENLDWHCLDPDGSIWKRKNPEEYFSWIKKHPGEDVFGHSRYHRPYQASILRCLHEDTNVFMADGTLKTIEDIEIGDKVITYNEGRKKIQSSYKVLNKWFNGYQDTYKVTLENGDTLKVTDNHPILSWFKDGKQNQLLKCKSFKRVYKSLSEGVDIGTKIYTLNKFGIFGNIEDNDLAKLLGYIVTDGYVANSGLVGRKHVLEFRNIRKEYVEEFSDILGRRFGINKEISYHPERMDKNGVLHKEHWSVVVFNRNTDILKFLREIGCTGKKNREISILKYSFKFSEESLRYFINRCWSGDGCVYNKKDDINRKGLPLVCSLTLSSGNKEYLSLYRFLLKKIGIYSSHIYTDIKKTGSTSISLNIGRINDIETFFNFCGPIFGKEKQSILGLKETMKRNHWRNHGGLKTLSRTKIVDIKHLGMQPVYDIEVDVRHNFVADGIVVHNCSSRRKVMRIGRQCLVGDTKVHLSNGTSKRIEDIKTGDEILSFVNEEMFPRVVTDQWYAGEKKVFRIKTKFGHIIECTYDHRFLTIENYLDKSRNITASNSPIVWGSISDKLKVGSKIGIAYSLPPTPLFDEIELAKFLGYFISDGSCSYAQSAKFTNINMDYLLEFEELSKFLGTNVRWYKKGNGYDLIISNGRRGKNPVRDLLKEFNLVGITGPQKLIPERIMNGSFATMRAFLNRFWSGDGYISTFVRTGRSTKRTEIGTLQENEELLCQIKEMLWKFGVHGYIKKEGNCYRFVISNKNSVKNFIEMVGPIFGKEAACNVALENLEFVSDKYSHITKDILWDYISSIEYIGYKDTWDIEVDSSKNFAANGFVTHNSGKTEVLVISALYNLFTKPGVSEEEGFRIVIITPFQSQIDLIFNRMDELLRGNPSVQSAVRSRTKSPPCKLVLNNNSMVTGFTAGTKSGGNADSVRGQKANMLILDEADYLNSGDLDSALSIITNFPNAVLCMSSTPKGTRDKFYNACQSRIYKEFHYPSYVNPLWSDELEATFREQFTEMAYKHEVQAEFGEQEEGVFQNAYIENAQTPYTYGSIIRDPNWIITFGVDWNDTKIGTNIAVVGFNPLEQVFYLLDRKVVSRDGWTQIAACSKIAEMNQFWRPDFIYVDDGFGSTQIEILRKFGYDSLMDKSKGFNHPDSKLKDIVKGYKFGGTVEIHDLITKQPIKKPAKPFLVENTVRRFETGTFKFAESDEIFVKQLLGYVVDHVSVSGVPVYKASNPEVGDHALDAVMLALVAFTLEKTNFGKPSFDINFTFCGKIGEKTDIDTEGLIVVTNDKRENPRDGNRPSMSRTEGVVQEKMSLIPSAIEQLPGSHLNQGSNGTKLWAWSGFSYDKPRPKAKSNSSIRKGPFGVSVRASRPKRKHF